MRVTPKAGTHIRQSCGNEHCYFFQFLFKKPTFAQILCSRLGPPKNTDGIQQTASKHGLSFCSALPHGRFPSSLTPSRPVLGGHL